MSFSVPTKPSWLSWNGSKLSGTPTNNNVGNHSVKVRVTDNAGSWVEQSFTITVNNVEDYPYFTNAPVSNTISVNEDDNAAAGSVYSYTPTGADVDSGSSVSFSMVSTPGWLEWTGSTLRNRTNRPNNSDANSGNYPGFTDYSSTIRITDNTSRSVDHQWTMRVHNTNDSPVVTTPPNATLDDGQSYSYTISASDVDSSLSYSLVSNPSWLGISGNVISGTANSPGTSTVTIRVSDGTVNVDKSFTITVNQADKEDWGWLKGGYSSVKARFSGTNQYYESDPVNPGTQVLNASQLNAIINHDGTTNPRDFTISTIIYNFNIGTFSSSPGPDGHGRYLWDIGPSDSNQIYKYGHSLRLDRSEDGGNYYVHIDSWHQWYPRGRFEFYFGKANGSFATGKDWKITYAVFSDSAGDLNKSVQVSYRNHGSGNSWTSFGTNTYTGGYGQGWISYSNDLHWSTGNQSSTDRSSDSYSHEKGGESYRPAVNWQINELHNFPLTVGSASATGKSDRRMKGVNNMRVLVIHDRISLGND